MTETQVTEISLIGINIMEQRSIVLDNTGNHKDQTSDQTTEDFLMIAPLFFKGCKKCTLIVVDAGPRRF